MGFVCCNNEFLEKSLQVSKDAIPQRDENDNIQTLAIGKRENAYYRRIYKMDSALKFELEIKKSKAKSYHNYLLNLNQTFPEFENLIVRNFYQYLKIALVLDTKFTNWLTVNLRKTKKPFNNLVSITSIIYIHRLK